jgi:hypothetical protein
MVAQALERVPVCAAFGRFARVEILDRDGAARAAYQRHLSQYAGGIFKMMEGEAAYGQVELGGAERQIFRVTRLKADVVQTAIAPGAIGDRQRSVGQVEPHHFAASRRQRHRDISGPVGDFEGAIGWRRIDGGG